MATKANELASHFAKEPSMCTGITKVTGLDYLYYLCYQHYWITVLSLSLAGLT